MICYDQQSRSNEPIAAGHRAREHFLISTIKASAPARVIPFWKGAAEHVTEKFIDSFAQDLFERIQPEWSLAIGMVRFDDEDLRDRTLAQAGRAGDHLHGLSRHQRSLWSAPDAGPPRRDAAGSRDQRASGSIGSEVGHQFVGLDRFRGLTAQNTGTGA